VLNAPLRLLYSLPSTAWTNGERTLPQAMQLPYFVGELTEAPRQPKGVWPGSI